MEEGGCWRVRLGFYIADPRGPPRNLSTASLASVCPDRAGRTGGVHSSPREPLDCCMVSLAWEQEGGRGLWVSLHKSNVEGRAYTCLEGREEKGGARSQQSRLLHAQFRGQRRALRACAQCCRSGRRIRESAACSLNPTGALPPAGLCPGLARCALQPLPQKSARGRGPPLRGAHCTEATSSAEDLKLLTLVRVQVFKSRFALLLALPCWHAQVSGGQHAALALEAGHCPTSSVAGRPV